MCFEKKWWQLFLPLISSGSRTHVVENQKIQKKYVETSLLNQKIQKICWNCPKSCEIMSPLSSIYSNVRTFAPCFQRAKQHAVASWREATASGSRHALHVEPGAWRTTSAKAWWWEEMSPIGSEEPYPPVVTNMDITWMIINYPK